MVSHRLSDIKKTVVKWKMIKIFYKVTVIVRCTYKIFTHELFF